MSDRTSDVAVRLQGILDFFIPHATRLHLPERVKRTTNTYGTSHSQLLLLVVLEDEIALVRRA